MDLASSLRREFIGSIAGKITDSATHKGLHGVMLTLSGYQSRTSTDAGGNYIINDLAAASDLTLVATMENYKEVSVAGVTISGGDMLTKNFTR